MASMSRPGRGVMQAEGESATILLVEDSEAGRLLMTRLIHERCPQHDIRIARDGVEALAMLRGEAPFAAVHRPNLILLDLNMPRMDGREVLALTKQDRALRIIPVLVLSTSAYQGDVEYCYDRYANAYM